MYEMVTRVFRDLLNGACVLAVTEACASECDGGSQESPQTHAIAQVSNGRSKEN